jgi:hypothetical protein
MLHRAEAGEKDSTQSGVGWRDFWPLTKAPLSHYARRHSSAAENQSLIIVSISVSFADVRRRPTAVTGTELQRVQTVPTIGGPLISGLEKRVSGTIPWFSRSRRGGCSEP